MEHTVYGTILLVEDDLSLAGWVQEFLQQKGYQVLLEHRGDTVLPLLHWLPKPQFRSALRAMGKGFFAEESNLNLMSAGELLRAAQIAAGDQFDFRVETEALGGWPANLLLIGMRRGAGN